MIPAEVAEYGQRVAVTLRQVLGPDFVGAYFLGSIALGGYVPGESDVDIAALTSHHVPGPLKHRIADALLDPVLACPARGLEFTLYRLEVVALAPEGADFEVNVNGGPHMARSVNLEPLEQPAFWWTLDRAIAHRVGLPIQGPPAHDVFCPIGRGPVLEAMVQSMRWHRAHEGATLYSVLNACRAWRFAVEDVLGSKLDGATWARARWPNTALIDSAVELRQGKPATLGAEQVEEFLVFVEGALVDNS